MTEPTGEPPAPDAFVPRRFRRGATARAHTFGLVATSALFAPSCVERDWRTFESVAGADLDGGFVVVLLAALALFAWPSFLAPGRTPARHGILAAAFALAATAPFSGLAVATATGRTPATIEVALAALVLAATTLIARIGGPGVGFLALGAAVGALFVPGGARDADEHAPPVAPPPAAELRPVRVELVGPFQAATARVADGVPLRIRADLAAGESRVLRGWIAVPNGVEPLESDIAIAALEPTGGAERVRVELLEPPSPGALAADPLARRGRPVAPGPQRRPPTAEILLAWSFLFVITAFGGRAGLGRPIAVSTLCVLLSAAGWWLCRADIWRPDGPIDAARSFSGGIRVYDGVISADGSARWLEVDRAAGVLAVDSDAVGEAVAAASVTDGRPAGTSFVSDSVERYATVLGAERSYATIEASPGAVAEVVRRSEGPGGLAIDGPGLGFESAWMRSADGAWSFHGAWERGGELPTPRSGPDPPGWAVIGLPFGARAIVARIDPTDFDGLEEIPRIGPPSGRWEGPGRPSQLWLRVVLE